MGQRKDAVLQRSLGGVQHAALEQRTRQACARYPNMRIFDWASVARPGWFISDGIHYTSAGYAARAQLIAGALAKAFPGGGHSHGCVVR